MKKISILGCGWLGLPLAKSLLEKGFVVKGSTTTLEKISIFEKAGIQPFLLELSETEIKGDITSFLEKSDILIIDIPPKLLGLQKENFVVKIQNLIPFIEKAKVENMIFVSSTSVYADDNSTVTENTKPQPDTESGKQLLEAEIILQSNPNFKTTVLRFGGLIGDDRHPIHFLSGKTNIENPNAPINLIHQKDCIGILEALICFTVPRIRENEVWNETFNAVAPYHPSRATYYTQKAIELNLPLPEFDKSKSSVGKTISTEKIELILNYTFQKPQL